MPHKDWCEKTCGECQKSCGLDSKIPCSPDCEFLSHNGEPYGEDCKYCDALNIHDSVRTWGDNASQFTPVQVRFMRETSKMIEMFFPNADDYTLEKFIKSCKEQIAPTERVLLLQKNVHSSQLKHLKTRAQLEDAHNQIALIVRQMKTLVDRMARHTSIYLEAVQQPSKQRAEDSKSNEERWHELSDNKTLLTFAGSYLDLIINCWFRDATIQELGETITHDNPQQWAEEEAQTMLQLRYGMYLDDQQHNDENHGCE